MTETRPKAIQCIQKAYQALREWLQVPRSIPWDYGEIYSDAPVQNETLRLGPDTVFSEASFHTSHIYFYLDVSSSQGGDVSSSQGRNRPDRQVHVVVFLETHLSVPAADLDLVRITPGYYIRSGYSRVLNEKTYPL